MRIEVTAAVLYHAPEYRPISEEPGSPPNALITVFLVGEAKSTMSIIFPLKAFVVAEPPFIAPGYITFVPEFWPVNALLPLPLR
jgi:hypothetical protein